MKQLSYLLILSFAALVFNNCGTDDYVWTDDGTTNDSTNIDSLNVNRLVVKKVYFQLPTELESVAKDWTVNTIFSTDNKSTDSLTAEFYDENSQELIVALNESGNVTLMAFQSAFGKDSIEMSLETTAKAMVMLMPWTQNMAGWLKKQVIDDLPNHPEFNNLVDAIKLSLKGGELDPLVIAPVLNELAVLQEKASNKKLEKTEDPVVLAAENNTITIKNRKSSAYLGVGIYDENNNLVKVDKVDGFLKSSSTLEDLKAYLFNGPKAYPTVEFEIEKAGDYNLVIDNGFTGEESEENSLAFKWNAGRAVIMTLGFVSDIFSTEEPGMVKCAVGFVENYTSFGNEIYSAIQSNSADQSTGYTERINLVATHSKNLLTYLSGCNVWGKSWLKINPGMVKKILNTMSVFGKAQKLFDSGFFVYDLYKYNEKQEFCLEMDENGEFTECSKFDFEGTWRWEMINYSSKAGEENALYIEIITTDRKGVYDGYYSYNYPRTSGKWYNAELPGSILLTFEDGEITLPGSGEPKKVIVKDHNAETFYSDNWDSTYDQSTVYTKYRLSRQ